jgi:transposase-like protein
MSKRYARDHKILALKIMQDFKWDVVKASRYTNIPERTLRQWRREWREKAARSRANAAVKTKMPKQQLRP